MYYFGITLDGRSLATTTHQLTENLNVNTVRSHTDNDVVGERIGQHTARVHARVGATTGRADAETGGIGQRRLLAGGSDGDAGVRGRESGGADPLGGDGEGGVDGGRQLYQARDGGGGTSVEEGRGQRGHTGGHWVEGGGEERGCEYIL